MIDALQGLQLPQRPELVVGAGAVERLGALSSQLGAGRVLLVTDPGIVEAGHIDKAQASLRDSGLEVTVFDQVHENPTTADVEAAASVARAMQPDVLIGFGGGSAMDTAKGCNFLYTNGGAMADYWGVGKAQKPMLPMIAVPTTAGTGSECQSFALITDPNSHQKMACGDPKALPEIAVLDPHLTITQPQTVAANTGIDALSHIVETAVTKRRSEQSWSYSKRAFELAVSALPVVVERGDNVETRAHMQLAAALAGAAIEQSMLGAAHSAANPLTAHFGVVHGQAVGVMLPAVVRFNGQDPVARQVYAELVDGQVADGSEVLATMIENLLALIGLPRSLDTFGITESDLDMLAEEAAKQWTAQFNPRPVDSDIFRQLYCARLAGP